MTQDQKILLITPPMTQLSTPYPATAYLKGFLKSRGIEASQVDASLDLALELFSKEGLTQVAAALPADHPHESVQFFLSAREDYIRVIDAVVEFLQGSNSSLAYRLFSRSLVPEGPRFLQTDDLEFYFGTLGIADQAKHIASLFIDDLADVIREGIDPSFQLSRYAEKLSSSQISFSPILKELNSKPTLITRTIEKLTETYIEKFKPTIVALTVPFPGNLFGALVIARTFKRLSPHTQILMGGGYANTELRELSDPRLFDFIDYLTLDDGERPILSLLELFQGKRTRSQLLRTFYREQNKVVFVHDKTQHDIPFKDSGTPTYEGLRLNEYISMIEMLNPVSRLWSDVRWNKLTLAHGCYWKKCSFCDTSLDYIGRYETASVDLILERMIAISQETGSTGFHFVDEAAPPALLKNLSQKIIERGLTFTWWGNIRFEKAFDDETCALMSDAGCIAVTGGLEVASPRLLKLMNKGVTLEQVEKVTASFQKARVFVHAYLMYGFPTQTKDETLESLENVRKLFLNGNLKSAFWHRFSATRHSPVAKNPEVFNITVSDPLASKPKEGIFSVNDLSFHDPLEVDHDHLGKGLRVALYNYMLGVGLEKNVKSWFR